MKKSRKRSKRKQIIKDGIKSISDNIKSKSNSSIYRTPGKMMNPYTRLKYFFDFPENRHDFGILSTRRVRTHNTSQMGVYVNNILLGVGKNIDEAAQDALLNLQDIVEEFEKIEDITNNNKIIRRGIPILYRGRRSDKYKLRL